MALSSAIMQNDQVQSAQPEQISTSADVSDAQPNIDNNASATARSLLKDPLKRNRSLHARPITKELIKDCREVAREVSPQLAMWLERLETNNSREEFEQALQRNARYLLGLVELRERNPVLYDIKMRELKTGSEIKQITALLQEAVNTGSTDQAEMLEMRLRVLVRMQATYSIEADGKYLLRIKEYAADLEKQIGEQGASFNETAEQQLQEILDKIKSNSTAKPQNPITSG